MPTVQPPYTWLNPILEWAAVVAILFSIALLVVGLFWSLFRPRGKSKRFLLASLASFLLFPALVAADYGLIQFVQLSYVRAAAEEDFQQRVQQAPGTRTHVGDEMPVFSLPVSQGSPVRSSDFQGKVLVLNFFATWCGPCREELPHLQQIWDELHDHSDFAMLVVGREETEDSVAAFKTEQGHSFAMAADPRREVYGLFAEQGIPRTYVFSRDGKIVYQCAGFYETELAKLNEVLRRELATAPHRP